MRFRRLAQVMHCKTCGGTCFPHEATEAARIHPKQRTQSGSGVIAGRIVVGRGSKWW